jgi:glutamate synthase domain-containing protein 1
MAHGKDLGEALEGALDDLDGFFTFVVGTKNGFGVVRDPIACKPAVMAETDQYVAFGSEYRALANLPGIEMRTSGNPSRQPSISGSIEKAGLTRQSTSQRLERCASSI